MNEICTVILAAGKGTRMKSARPKVMHAILDLPLICYPMRLARAAGNLTVGLQVYPCAKKRKKSIL